MCEARVAADAIGSLAVVYRSALRSCAWKQSINKHLTPLCGFDFDYISYTLGNGGYAPHPSYHLESATLRVLQSKLTISYFSIRISSSNLMEFKYFSGVMKWAKRGVSSISILIP